MVVWLQTLHGFSNHPVTGQCPKHWSISPWLNHVALSLLPTCACDACRHMQPHLPNSPVANTTHYLCFCSGMKSRKPGSRSGARCCATLPITATLDWHSGRLQPLRSPVTASLQQRNDKECRWVARAV